MSNQRRLAMRETYMRGWYEQDIDLLLATTAPDFIFDDPVEPYPIDRAGLNGYMLRWNERMSALGGANEWRLTYHQRQDCCGLITDWEWWEVIGTGVEGTAVVLTSDRGVILERITYFDRETRNAAGR